MNGAHYTMFDQLLHTEKNDLDVMSRGLREYLQVLEQKEYKFTAHGQHFVSRNGASVSK